MSSAPEDACVVVHAEDPAAILTAGIFKGRTVAAAVASQGARLLPAAALGGAGEAWPVLLLGPGTPVPPGKHLAALRASWRGWTARVAPARLPGETAGTVCVLAAIAAAALGVSEAFGAVRSAPGSDAGYRDVRVNLWNPGGDREGNGPDLAHAPAAWWLVGLGHLGQASAWVISWLPYADPSSIEAVLQDTDRTTPANYSTGVLTPEGSDGVPKTRLTAAALEKAGLSTRIIERRAGSDFRAAPGECHVALLGVDNLPTRRLTSGAGWTLAIDTGLGDQPGNFDSILIHRFPRQPAQRRDPRLAAARAPRHHHPRDPSLRRPPGTSRPVRRHRTGRQGRRGRLRRRHSRMPRHLRGRPGTQRRNRTCHPPAQPHHYDSPDLAC